MSPNTSAHSSGHNAGENVREIIKEGSDKVQGAGRVLRGNVNSFVDTAANTQEKAPENERLIQKGHEQMEGRQDPAARTMGERV